MILEDTEFEFTPEYLKQAFKKFKRGAYIISEPDIKLTNGERYSSWFHHGFDDKKYPIARLTLHGRHFLRGLIKELQEKETSIKQLKKYQ